MKRLPANRTKSSTTIRQAITWWNKLSYPERYDIKKLCYPEQKSVHVTDKQKDNMFNLVSQH